ncbi:MAG TPA: hypothetical protein VMC48_05930 [Methanobacterium sp.]|nr:hypothetical protein [Methanobacterium sp.]
MTPLEVFLVLVLAGIIIVLLYFYMQGDTMALSRARSAVVDTGDRIRSNISGNEEEGEKSSNGKGIGDTMTGMNEKARSAFAGASGKITDATDKINIDRSSVEGVTEKVSGLGEKVKGTVKGVPTKSDELSEKIDLWLDERKDQIIEDWELSTKTDVSGLEKKYLKLSTDVSKLDSSFNEFKASSNKKFKDIEDRLAKLEKP